MSRRERDYNDEGMRGSKERAAIVKQNLPTTTPDSSWTLDEGERRRGNSVLYLLNYLLQAIYSKGIGGNTVINQEHVREGGSARLQEHGKRGMRQRETVRDQQTWEARDACGRCGMRGTLVATVDGPCS